MPAYIPVVHNTVANTHEPVAATDTLSLNAAQLQALAALINSASPGNAITLGADGLLHLNVQAAETTTSMSYNALATVLSYTDEDGVVSNFDLSALTADINADTATYNPATTTLTMTDTDGSTITVNFASLASQIAVNNTTGVLTHTSGTGVITTIARVSADAGNDIGVGTDGGAFLDVQAAETATTFAGTVATSGITHTNEDGVAVTVRRVSADAGNSIGIGTDGGAFFAGGGGGAVIGTGATVPVDGLISMNLTGTEGINGAPVTGVRYVTHVQGQTASTPIPWGYYTSSYLLSLGNSGTLGAAVTGNFIMTTGSLFGVAQRSS